MSAFFISINRDKSLYDLDTAKTMMTSLSRFGHDGSELIVRDHFAIGYQSLWSVPEEQGERQPLFDKTSGCWTCFYGRIDNRDVLFDLLDMDVEPALSDAQLLCLYLRQFGTEKLNVIIGPFVFVQFNPNMNHIVAARDGMGGRPLCFHINDKHIHIATYDLAIAKHPSVGYQLNDERVARMISGVQEMQPSSPLKGVTPLKPGEYLLIENQTHCIQSFYVCDPKRRVYLPDDRAYASEFKRLLNQAVKRRLRTIGSVGSMMSGGMDSVPISISAAEQLAKQNKRLTALSWVFDKYPECDEREYSSLVCQQFDIEQSEINCDDVWPSFDEQMHLNPVVPFSIPFSEYQQAALRNASQRGIRTVLTGIHGDLLYEATQSILFELLKRGQWRNAWREACLLAKASLSKKQFVKQYLLAQLPIVKQGLHWYRQHRRPVSHLLKDSIQAKLKPQEHYLNKHSKQALRPYQYQIVLGHEAGEDLNFGGYMDAKFGLERRYPFRDRDLVEFMLAIPSEQLFYNLNNRPIVKRAFYADLPLSLQKRNLKTDFSRVIQAGILSDNKARHWFKRKNAAWLNYISTEFVKQCYFDEPSSNNTALNVVAWRCAYYEYWKSVCYNSSGKTQV